MYQLIHIEDLGDSHGGFSVFVNKGAGHKYVKRELISMNPKKYRYWYRHPKSGIVTENSLKVGSKFRHGSGEGQRGHYEVQGRDEKSGMIFIKHDVTNHTAAVSMDQLKDMIHGGSHDVDDILRQRSEARKEQRRNAREQGVDPRKYRQQQKAKSKRKKKKKKGELPRIPKISELPKKEIPVPKEPTIQTHLQGPTGNKTHVFYAGESGQPVALEGEYRLIEAHDMVPSHDPTTFAKNKAYPEGLQERAYHRDKAERSKVRTNAQHLHPALVVNTNPDALNGPPILNEDGVVLGGNSRAMSLQLVHAQSTGKADQLKDYMAEHAHQVGMSPEDVASMKNPVLVRVVKAKGKDPNLLVRAMNEGFTQGMDPRTKQVAMARRLDDKALESMANSMGSDQTLRSYLDSESAKGFITELDRVGIIDDRNRNQYMTKSGKLNEDGKTLVERVLVGKMVNDPELLSNTRTSMISAIARAVPYMIQAESAGKGYNLRKELSHALSGYNKMHDLDIAPHHKAKGKALESSINNVRDHMNDWFEGKHPVNENPRASSLFDLLIKRGGINQLASTFREYSKQAQANRDDSPMLGGIVEPLSHEQIFDQSIRRSMDKEKKAEAPPPQEAPPMGFDFGGAQEATKGFSILVLPKHPTHGEFIQ